MAKTKWNTYFECYFEVSKQTRNVKLPLGEIKF